MPRCRPMPQSPWWRPLLVAGSPLIERREGSSGPVGPLPPTRCIPCSGPPPPTHHRDSSWEGTYLVVWLWG
jgi:hypothetical protein